MAQRRTYTTTEIPRRATRTVHPQPTQVLPETAKRRARSDGGHVLTSVGIGMVIVLLGWLAWVGIVLPIMNGLYDQWHYGDGHIAQYDLTINGRHDHLLAETNKGKVYIVDVRDNDASKTVVFVSPQTGAASGAIVTLSLADVVGNGDSDVVIHVDGLSDAVLYSNGNSLQWQVPTKK